MTWTTCQSYWCQSLCNSHWVYKGVNTGHTGGVTIEVAQLFLSRCLRCAIIFAHEAVHKEKCCFMSNKYNSILLWFISSGPLFYLFSQNETTKGQRGRCTQNDSLSPQSKCVCDVFASFSGICTSFVFFQHAVVILLYNTNFKFLRGLQSKSQVYINLFILF